jgi:hypothetical protein
MARRGNRREHPRVQTNEKALATSACEIITEIMGEIHAARIVGVLAVSQPGLFQTVQPHFIVRVALGAIVLALRKFEDLWNHQIKPVLLRQSIPVEGAALHRELTRRKFRDFCSRVVAHYAEGDYRNPKTPLTKIEGLLRAQGFESDLAFFMWTSDVVATMEKIRTAIGHKHGVEELKWRSP